VITLSTLKNTHRPKKRVQRVGRGVGSKRGKTCCRGAKGDKARRGFKNMFGKEGGQLPLYRKLPTKGFSNKRFSSDVLPINLGRINSLFNDGEVVNLKTLKVKGFAPSVVRGGLKVLAMGDLEKNVSIEAHFFSKKAIEKLESSKKSFQILTKSVK
jgi:large subunit ribosomal protein L15